MLLTRMSDMIPVSGIGTYDFYIEVLSHYFLFSQNTVAKSEQCLKVTKFRRYNGRNRGRKISFLKVLCNGRPSCC